MYDFLLHSDNFKIKSQPWAMCGLDNIFSIAVTIRTDAQNVSSKHDYNLKNFSLELCGF